MKKTMIAIAVAGVVAAPIASADVKISGVVEQTFTDTENDGDGLDSSTFNMLNVSASEDLGNGMTAFAKYNHLTKTGKNSTETNGDQVVGIASSMGTIVAGTMEDFTEGKVMSMMTLEGTGAIELAGNATRTEGGIAYVSPTVSGFHVGIAGYAASDTVENTDSLDATDVAIFYDNGPFSLKIAQETVNTAVADAIAGTSAAAVDQKTTSVGGSYTMGDLKVSALSVSRSDQGGVAGTDSDDFMVRVDYTMGNNKITVANADDDSANADYTAVELIHSFSGRTSAYIGNLNNDATNNDSTYFGLKHKF